MLAWVCLLSAQRKRGKGTRELNVELNVVKIKAVSIWKLL